MEKFLKKEDLAELIARLVNKCKDEKVCYGIDLQYFGGQVFVNITTKARIFEFCLIQENMPEVMRPEDIVTMIENPKPEDLL